jgi:hypothetical protein
MLAEVIYLIELLASIALTELVDVLKMLDTFVPVLLYSVTDYSLAHSASITRELFAAVATGVCLARVASALIEHLTVGESRARPAI